MRKCLAMAAAWFLGRLGWRRGVAQVAESVRRYVKRERPEQALRFLLELDREIYGLQGRMGKAYGEGEHPKHRLTGYHDFFVGRLKAGERVLDVGCGRGELAADMARRADVSVWGMDLSAANISTARKRYPMDTVTFLEGDVCSDLPAEHYDVVVLSNVLEHIQNRVTLLKDLVARVTPARLLIRVPAFDRDWRVPLRKELGLEWRLDSTHETEYTHESFETELAEASLKIVYMEIRWGEIWAEAVPEVGGL